MTKDELKFVILAIERQCDVPCYGGHPLLETALEICQKALKDHDGTFIDEGTKVENEQMQSPIKWTLDGEEECGYNNWLGETSFGRILITWKGWKDHPNACVDDFPGGFQAYGDPDEVKAACESEFYRRLGTVSIKREPLTDEQIEKFEELAIDNNGWGFMNRKTFARLIERAHGIKE